MLICSNYLQSPHLFVCVDLCSAEDSSPVQTSMSNPLAGTSVSSLYKLKDIDDTGETLAIELADV